MSCDVFSNPPEKRELVWSTLGYEEAVLTGNGVAELEWGKQQLHWFSIVWAKLEPRRSARDAYLKGFGVAGSRN